MKLNNIIKDFKFDKRMIDWGLRYKSITHKEYEQHIKSLPDTSADKERVCLEDADSCEDSKNE